MTDGGETSRTIDIFDEHYREYDEWYEKNRFAYLSELEAVKKAVPGSGCGLEIGVGSGRFAVPLNITVGIDPSHKMVELARERGVDARPGTGEKLLFEDDTFDYVAIIFTLCFTRDPEKVIAESARVLNPGGRLVVAIVDKKSFLGREYMEKGSIFYRRARFFTVDEVTGMLNEEGFRDFSYYQTISARPDVIKAVERPEQGCGRGAFVVISAHRA